MKHLDKLEISRIIGIKYKGSKSKEDVLFLNKAMDHILICQECRELFKKKTDHFIQGLNYKMKEKEIKQENILVLCKTIFEKGMLSVVNMSEQFSCIFEKELAFNRDEYDEVPDYIFRIEEEYFIVQSFEEQPICIIQNHEMIEPISINKDDETYEIEYIFKYVNINEPFECVIKK